MSALTLARLGGATPDDAFITFRYAENLADGHGWRYNLDAASGNAATAPLYTMVLAVGDIVLGSPARASSALFLGSLAAMGFFAFDLIRRGGSPLAGLLVGLFLVTSPWLASTRGMESVSFLACVLGAAAAYARGWTFSAGAVVAIATAIRADGALMAVVLLALHAFGTRKPPVRMMIGMAVVAVPWLVVSTAITGTLVPETLSAKIAQRESGFWGSEFSFLEGARTLPTRFRFAPWARLVLLAGIVGAATAWFSPSRMRRVVFPLLLFCGAHFFAYAVIIRPPDYHWYYTPMVTGMLVLAGVGAAELVQAGRRHRDGLRAGLGIAVGAGLVVTGLLGLPRGTFHPYLHAVDWLNQHTDRNASVAAAEIGMIGYYTDRPIVDFLGLLTEESVEDLRRGDLRSWLAREEPDYWLVHKPVWGVESPATLQPWFQLAYRPVWDSFGLVMFERVRPTRQAERLANRRLRPLARETIEEAGALPVGASTERTQDSLVAALSAYVMRDDLQAAFGRDRVALGDLVTWAAGPGSSIDASAPALSPYRDTYEQLAGPLAHVGSVPAPALAAPA